MQEIAGLRVAERLHDGIRSIVYRAERPDGTTVVLKTLQGPHPTARQVAELRREQRILSSIHSVHVVRPLEAVPHGNGVALVLEDTGAISLAQYLAPGVPPLADALRIARDLAAALESVHAQGVVHKDVKPANVVVNPLTLELRLIDFGISSLLQQETAEAASPDAIEGTLAYISPEQTGRMNRPIDQRSDLYSFGVVLYELLSGQLPFDSQDPLELVHCHCARTPTPLEDYSPLVPPVLLRMTRKLLSKDAEDRYQSAHGVRADLDRCLALLAAGQLAAFELGQGDAAARLQLSRRLYGREEELRALHSAFARCRKAARVLLVAGAPGIGKSALIREVARPIASSRGYFVEGKFDQFERDRPYASLVQAFGGLVRQLLTESTERLDAWRRALLDGLGANLSVLADIIPELALIVGPQPAPAPLPATEARNRFDDSFLHFIRVFARPESPMALFLDDLQWVDSGSLRLLQALATDDDLAGLLVVGTYRDNEVDAHHPLTRTLDRVARAGGEVDRLELGPLEGADVRRLLTESLHCPEQDAAPLASLLLRKTGGNPFFVRQFLRSLHAEGLLFASGGVRRWTWDLGAIEERDITDNVAELLSDRIRVLPDATTDRLQLAACLGNTLTLGDLAEAAGSDATAIGAEIWPAIQAGLLVPLGRAHRWLEAEVPGLDEVDGLRIRFLHDRVQQAAYSLRSEDERRPIHLTIARRLHAAQGAEPRLFATARHYGAALALLTDPQERERAARVHLDAGQAARRSNAYGPALQLLERGLVLASKPTLRRDLEVQRGVCACLLGDREGAKACFERALAASPDPLDRADVRAEWIQALLNEGDHEGVVALGRDSLQDLGRPVPAEPEAARAAGAELLDSALTALGPGGAWGILDLPPITDRRSRAIAHTLGMVSPSVYIRDPDEGQFLWVAATAIAVLQEAGTSPESAHGCSLVGMVLYQVSNRRLGSDFLDVGVALAERDGDPMALARATTCRSFYRTRQAPLDDALEQGRVAWERCLEAGEWFHAGWAAWTLMSTTSLVGTPPAAALAEGEGYVNFLRPRAPELQGVCEAFLRKNLALMGRTDSPTTFAGPGFDADAYWAGVFERNIEVEVVTAATQKAWLLVLFGQWSEAERLLAEADAKFATLSVFNEGAETAFLRGLCRAAAGDPDGLAAQVERLRPWAEDEPRSFGPRARLLEAEHAALTGPIGDTITAFERCIEDAAGQPMLRALAQERAGRALLGTSRERFARVYLSDARNGWELLGVQPMVDHLGQAFPDRASRSRASESLRVVPIDETLSTSFRALPALGANRLDLETFARASRAIASEVELDGLLRTLLHLAVENAGATAGALVIWEDGEPRVRGRVLAGTEVEIRTVNEPLRRTHVVPRSVVLGVARLKEPTIIDDCKQELRFARDPYFLVQSCRSAAALPIVHGGQLSGVLYLENDQATGAFTPARTELLSLLSSQVAIALENTRLFQETRSALEHVRKLNESHRRFVPRELLGALGKRSVLDLELGEHVQGSMAVLFADIRGFTSLSEELGAAATFDFINRYLAVAGPVIRDCGGYIDKYIGDAIMAVFPRCADDALDAAVALQDAVDRFNQAWRAEGHAPITIGVGVHLGDVVLGTVGEVERMEGTVISDAVNVASRLEGQCKVLNVGIVASAEVFAACRQPTRQPRRALGEVQVKGRAQPLTVFELVTAGCKTA